MAWVDRPVAVLTFQLVDETNSKSSMELYMPASTPADVALAGAATLRPLLQNITDCAILSYNVTYGSFDDSPETPAANSRVERKGRFSFLTAAGKKARVSVPGIDNLLILNTGRLDDDAAAIVAFTGALTAVDALFVDSNNSDLKKMLEAYEVYSGTTKQQLPIDRRPD